MFYLRIMNGVCSADPDISAWVFFIFWHSVATFRGILENYPAGIPIFVVFYRPEYAYQYHQDLFQKCFYALHCLLPLKG